MAGTAVPTAVRSYFDAINKEAWDLLDEALAEDVTVRPVGMAPVHGREAAKAHYATLLQDYPEHVDEPTRFLPSGDAVTVEINFRGKTSAGREIAFQAVDVFDLVDGRIAEVSIWFDTHGVVRQLRG